MFAVRERTRERTLDTELEDTPGGGGGVVSLEECLASLEYTVDESIEICTSKEFPAELLVVAQAQAPVLSEGEVVASLCPQVELGVGLR